MSIRQHAEQEFCEFVKQTYEGLCNAELKMLSAKSSIVVFVRFDIGLVESRGDGQVHYFVNKVERTQTMSLWSNRAHARSPKSPTGILGCTLAGTLYEWLIRITHPYSV
jgi:hypothetical protein